jgi:hypothetical protein
VQTRSGGSGEGIRANPFGRVGRGRPCKLVRAGRARASMQTRSGGSFEGIHVNSFGWVVQARARPGERAHIKNAKL